MTVLRDLCGGAVAVAKWLGVCALVFVVGLGGFAALVFAGRGIAAMNENQATWLIFGIAALVALTWRLARRAAR